MCRIHSRIRRAVSSPVRPSPCSGRLHSRAGGDSGGRALAFCRRSDSVARCSSRGLGSRGGSQHQSIGDRAISHHPAGTGHGCLLAGMAVLAGQVLQQRRGTVQLGACTPALTVRFAGSDPLWRRHGSPTACGKIQGTANHRMDRGSDFGVAVPSLALGLCACLTADSTRHPPFCNSDRPHGHGSPLARDAADPPMRSCVPRPATADARLVASRCPAAQPCRSGQHRRG